MVILFGTVIEWISISFQLFFCINLSYLSPNSSRMPYYFFSFWYCYEVVGSLESCMKTECMSWPGNDKRKFSCYSSLSLSQRTIEISCGNSVMFLMLVHLNQWCLVFFFFLRESDFMKSDLNVGDNRWFTFTVLSWIWPEKKQKWENIVLVSSLAWDWIAKP